jgi:DNA-binding Lrp family transcriptional regulator
MKSNKIYLIKFTKKVDLNTLDDFDHPIYKDLVNLLDKGDDKLIGFTNDENIFLRLPYNKVNEICNILIKHGFEFNVSDVTKLVIKGDIEKIYPEVEELNPGIFKNFRMENTSIDDILDKINEKGIGSIDEIDKEILNKFSS